LTGFHRNLFIADPSCIPIAVARLGAEASAAGGLRSGIAVVDPVAKDRCIRPHALSGLLAVSFQEYKLSKKVLLAESKKQDDTTIL
jgi:hypothetical protein